MATERFDTVIGLRAEGLGTAQKVLGEVRQVKEAFALLERIGNGSAAPAAGAFGGTTASQIGGQIREYDTLLRRIAEVRRAEIAQERVQRRLAIPEGDKGYVAGRLLREDIELGAKTRLDGAAERLVKALLAEAAAHEREAAKVARTREEFARARQSTGEAILDGRTRLREKREQDAAFAAFQPKYANADGSTPLGKARLDYNKAERAVEIAKLAEAETLNKNNVTLRQRQIAAQAVINAENALAAAERKVASQMASPVAGRGFGQTGSQFMTGFRGASERPYAEQIGQAFKFSVFYGTAYKLLFALTTTLQATLTEGIEFQSAMTELKIASGQSADAASDMAKGLADQATVAGLAPSQGVQIGARSLGLFGATEASGASAAEQERIATISARVVSRMALGSKTAPEELQTQIAAVANAFGGGAAGQLRAFDLDAYLGRQFGVQQGMTIQAVAEAGTVGQAAGFDQEQVSAIAAYLQSRTGQSPSAVAGWMAQIFSRGGEGSLTALTGKYGIDQNADLATQIEELARVYKDAAPQERADLAAGFGRGKVQNAAVVLLEGLDTVMNTADRARTESVGEGDKIFDTRIGDIGGQIAVTVSAMQAFASELGRSGVLDLLGLGVIAFRELVETATGLLQIWNELNPAIRSVVASLALLAIAARTGAGSTVAGALASRAGLISPSLAASTGVRAPMTSVLSGAAASGGFAAAGKAALAFVGPAGLAIGGLMAIASLKSSAEEMKRAQDAGTEALRNSGLSGASTGSDYLATASELDLLAKQNRDATGWLAQGLSFGTANDDNIAMAEELEREAARRREVADLIDARESNISVDAPAISAFDSVSIAESLDAITASGGTAQERLDALVSSLNGTADAAVVAASALDPEEFSARLADQLKTGVNGITEKINLGDAIAGAPDIKIPIAPKFRTFAGQSVDDAAPIYDTKSLNEVYEATQTELQNRLKKSLEERSISSTTDLNKQTSREIAEEIVQDSDFSSDLGDDQLAEAREFIVDMVARKLRGESMAWRAMLKQNRDLTAEQVAAVVEAINSEFDATLDDLSETDLSGRVRNRRGKLRELIGTQDSTSADDLPALMQSIATTRSEIAQAEIARLEAVRRVQQQNAGSAAEVRAAGARSLRRQLRAAIRGGEQDDLAEVISRAGKGAVAIARGIINEAIAAAQAALEVKVQIAAIQAAAGGILAGMAGVLGTVPDVAALAELQGLKDNLGTMATGNGDTFNKGTDVDGPEKFFEKPEKGKSAEDRKAEREAARQEMLDLKNNLYLLSIDLTDPLAQATAAVKGARRRLASDIGSGQDKGTIAAARVALRNAQAEREATAFQQRLDSVTTAEELGRISHQKYLSYLQNERRRLNSIKNRTFQQQQQLDQIDRLMKEAADTMQGQWNFGDIKLPTPYQVRRQVELMNPDRATALDATSRQVANQSTIYIDGADTGKVRQIITETLDKANATVTNRPRRR